MLLLAVSLPGGLSVAIIALVVLTGILTNMAYRIITNHSSPRYTWPVTVSHHSFTIKGIIMKIALHAGKEVPVVLGKPVKKDGTPAEIEEGSLKIEIVDGGGAHADSVVSWERDDQAANPDDPYTGKLVWHEAGDVILHMTGDADLGEGIETIDLDIDIEALDEEAVGFADPVVGAERDHVESTEGSEQA